MRFLLHSLTTVLIRLYLPAPVWHVPILCGRSSVNIYRGNMKHNVAWVYPVAGAISVVTTADGWWDPWEGGSAACFSCSGAFMHCYWMKIWLRAALLRDSNVGWLEVNFTDGVFTVIKYTSWWQESCYRGILPPMTFATMNFATRNFINNNFAG